MLYATPQKAWYFPLLYPQFLKQVKFYFLILTRGYAYWFLEREKGRENEREREPDVRENIDWLPVVWTPIRDQTSQPRYVPDWGSNPQPFGVWDDAPTNWATRPWPSEILL